MPSRRRRRLSNKARRFYARVTGWVFIVVGVGAAIGVGGVFLTHLDVWTITSVSVSGTDKLDPSSLRNDTSAILSRDYLGLFAARNALIYPSNTIRHTLKKQYPRIRSLSIWVDGLKTLRLQVAERSVYAELCPPHSTSTSMTQRCKVLDRDGFVFARRPATLPADQLTIYAPDATSTSIASYYRRDVFPRLRRLLDGIRSAGVQARAVIPRHDEDVRIRLKHGGSLRVRLDHDLDEMIENLQTVLTHKELPLTARQNGNTFRYIDLRFGDRVFYKDSTTTERRL